MTAFFAFVAAPAQAAIVVSTGAPGATTSENLLFANLGPSAAIETVTNKGTRVTFTGAETLETTAGGQAKISGADGQFNVLNFYASDPAQGFGAVEFSLSRLTGRGAPDSVVANVSFFDQFGTATTIGNAPISTGQSWFSAVATLGSAISRVEITTSANIRDARHFRITPMDVTTAVPEPATWLMLVAGFGLVGGALRRRTAKLRLA